MNINGLHYDYKKVNEQIRAANQDVVIENCLGQRYIGIAGENKQITVKGTPGNALGAYLNGAHIIVEGNAQDAVGDTMNDGKIVIRGSAGDALGYAMRGGKIFVKGDAGYRTGIHMKEYREKRPVIVVGGKTGSFLGEYLAGGLIIVLGLGSDDIPLGNFTGTGMHGGAIYVRSKKPLEDIHPQIIVEKLQPAQLEAVIPLLTEYAGDCGFTLEELVSGVFYKLTANAARPYKQLYTGN